MNPLLQPVKIFFKAAMMGMRPMRRAGAFGTPDDPLYFETGDTVPWWLECRWPLHADFVFGVDVETYHENGWQIVRPLQTMRGGALTCVKANSELIIVGAPTELNATPRPRRRIPRLSFNPRLELIGSKP